MRRLAFILVLALGLLAPRSVLAQASPTASVSTVDECYVGDSIPFRIMVENASSATPPDLDALLGRDWIVNFLGSQPSSQSMTLIINGRVQEQKSQSVMLVYTLSPRRAGEFTIPALQVEVQGKTLSTHGVRIKVTEPTASQGLGTSLAVTRAFVGQHIKLSISWVLSSAAENVTFNLNLPAGVFDVHPLPAPASQPGAAREGADLDYVEGVGGGTGKLHGSLTQVSIDGENRVRFSAEVLLVPRQAGKFECGGVRADYRAVVGKRDRGMFDAPWNSTNITQRRYAQAPVKTLEVVPLPTAGRPANFSGLVGEFDLDAECQPRQAAVGDPLNLTLVLRSKVPLLDPPAIDLSAQRSPAGALAEQFRVPRDPVLPQLAESTAIYSAQIRPRSDKLTELPPVELSYFDPVEAKYRIAKSNRIPLKIVAAPVVGLGALEGLDTEADDAAAGASPDQAQAKPTGPELVSGLYPPIDAVTPTTIATADPRPSAFVAVAAGSVAVPASLWLAGAFLAVRRRTADHHPVAWRRRGAVRRSARALRRAAPGDPAAISSVLRAFIADWFDLPPEALTTGEAVTAVQTLDPVLASQARSILDTCDSRLFSAQGQSPLAASMASEVTSLIREIARSQRTGTKPGKAPGAGPAPEHVQGAAGGIAA